MTTQSIWHKCSSCRKPLLFKTVYWVCNVSTCNRKRTALAFCSVDCWDAHLPFARHKDAWAEERTSPATGESHPQKPIARDMRYEGKNMPTGAAPTASITASMTAHDTGIGTHIGAGINVDLAPPPAKETLIVASKMKAYIKTRSGFNTSAAVLDVLSDKVRALCDEAILSAAQHERKTVLDRDF